MMMSRLAIQLRTPGDGSDCDMKAPAGEGLFGCEARFIATTETVGQAAGASAKYAPSGRPAVATYDRS